MTAHTDRPEHCHYRLWDGTRFIHACMARYGQPVEPTKQRHLKAVS